MTIQTLYRAAFVGIILILSGALIFSCEEEGGDLPESPGVIKQPSQPTEELPPGEKTYDEFGGQPADRTFTISGAEDWTEALTTIREGADDGEANYIIDITDSMNIPGSSAPTFGSRDDIAVIIQGDDITLTLEGTGNLIKTAAGQTVSVQDSVTLEGNSGNNTSVVSVPAGVFEMSGTAQVISNKATNNSGGGVNVSGGTFIMKGHSSVTGNSATGNAAGDGGGVYLNNGSFTMMEDAVISGNVSGDDGGGLHVTAGTFTMGGRAKITGNIAHNDTSNGADGGGIWMHNGTIVMKDEAEISGNTAWGNSRGTGGGIGMQGGTFRFGGGTITGYDANHAAEAHDPSQPATRDTCNINWQNGAVNTSTGTALYKAGGTAQYGLIDDVTGAFTDGGTDLASTSNTIRVVNGELQP